jgi:hypothetical protein
MACDGKMFFFQNWIFSTHWHVVIMIITKRKCCWQHTPCQQYYATIDQLIRHALYVCEWVEEWISQHTHTLTHTHTRTHTHTHTHHHNNTQHTQHTWQNQHERHVITSINICIHVYMCLLAARLLPWTLKKRVCHNYFIHTCTYVHFVLYT